MEEKQVRSICCKAPILEFPEYNLKVCSACKAKVTLHNKKQGNVKIYE